LYPSRYPKAALDQHTASLARSMDRADLSVVQIIDFDSFPDAGLWSTYLKRPQIDGLIYLEYSRYDAHKGQMVWANGKPVHLRPNDAVGWSAGSCRGQRDRRTE
jgi:GxGYxYP putative glycoside hydrolase C-terminal domain